MGCTAIRNVSESPIRASTKSLWSCRFLCHCGLFGLKLLVPDKHLGSPLPFASMFGDTLAVAEKEVAAY